MSLTQIGLIAVAFVVAGIAKGAIGMGMPPIAIGLMSLAVPLESAIAIMIVPTMVTNVWQAIYGGHFKPLMRRFGSMALTDPIMQRDLASVGVNVTERSSLSVAYATQTTWARERTNLIAVKQSMGVGRGTMSMSAGHSLEDNFGSSVFISYKRPFGRIKPLSRPMLDDLEELDLQLPQTSDQID